MSDTREYIIDEAYKLFLKKSYQEVSISDISNAIGFTKGALYHHFVNKEDLFKAVIDKYMSIIGLFEIKEGCTLAEFIESDIEQIKKIVYTICIDDKTFIPVNYMSLMIDALKHYPGYAENSESFFTNVINKLTVVIANAIKNGEAREDIDINLTALNFFTISVGIAANSFRENSPEQAIEMFRSQMIEYYKLIKK